MMGVYVSGVPPLGTTSPSSMEHILVYLAARNRMISPPVVRARELFRSKSSTGEV